MWHRHVAVNQTLGVKRSDTPIFLTDIRDFFNTWYPSACVPTRKKGMNVSLHLARQNSVQCIANLSHFLCITFSKHRRKPNGRRYFPNNRQHLAYVYFFSFLRATTRGRTQGKTRVAEFNYFRSEVQALSSPLRKFNVPETRRSACEKRETSGTMYWCTLCTHCSVHRNELSRSEMRCCSGSLWTGWKETGYTDTKVFLMKSSRRMRRSRSSDILLSALYSFHSQENYDLCEIKLRCPNWSLLMWSISEVSSVFLAEYKNETRELTLKQHIWVLIFTFLFLTFHLFRIHSSNFKRERKVRHKE